MTLEYTNKKKFKILLFPNFPKKYNSFIFLVNVPKYENQGEKRRHKNTSIFFCLAPMFLKFLKIIVFNGKIKFLF